MTQRSTYTLDLNCDGSGKVGKVGVTGARLGTVIARNDESIVVKWPSGKHFTSRGVQTYHSPSTEVYLIEKVNDSGTLRCRLVIGWDNTRKPQG